MRTACWHGSGDIRVESVPDPAILKPNDVIVRSLEPVNRLCPPLWRIPASAAGLEFERKAGDTLSRVTTLGRRAGSRLNQATS